MDNTHYFKSDDDLSIRTYYKTINQGENLTTKMQKNQPNHNQETNDPSSQNDFTFASFSNYNVSFDQSQFRKIQSPMPNILNTP